MNVTCVKCGWVHYAVSRTEAETQVSLFNAFFATLTRAQQQNLYGGKGAFIAWYETCHCGGQEFRPSQPGDCPDGVTIGPIIYEGGRG